MSAIKALRKPLLRIHKFILQTKVEGPGLRASVWVQGCQAHCQGCFNPDTWPASGGELVSIYDLAEEIIAQPNLSGVTFMGGEPMLQASPLAALAELTKSAGLSLVVFTGYYLDELKKSRQSGIIKLLNLTDLLIDGPFDSALAPADLPWVGSKNQNFHFLTDHYRPIAEEIRNMEQKLEVRLKPDGTIVLNGLAYVEDLNIFLDVVRKEQ